MWITHCNSWEGLSQHLSNSAACVGILCTFLGRIWLLSLSQTGCKTTWSSDLLPLFLCSYEVVSWGYMKDLLLGALLLFIHCQCLRQKDGHCCYGETVGFHREMLFSPSVLLLWIETHYRNFLCKISVVLVQSLMGGSLYSKSCHCMRHYCILQATQKKAGNWAGQNTEIPTLTSKQLFRSKSLVGSVKKFMYFLHK